MNDAGLRRTSAKARAMPHDVVVTPAPSLTRPVVILAAVLLALVVLVALVLRWWSGQPLDGRISDREHRVTIVLPPGWMDATDDDAGRIVTRDNSGDEIPPRRLPDLAAGTWDSREDVPGKQDIRIQILESDAQTLSQLHEQHVQATCAEDLGCRAPREVESLTVDGAPALSQFQSSVESSVTLWTVTILSGTTVVRFDGASTDLDDALSGGRLREPLGALHLQR